MNNVNALQLRGTGQLLDIIELPDEQGRIANIIWRSVDGLFQQEVTLKCAFNAACKVPYFLLDKVLHVSKCVIVNFTAQLIDITGLHNGQTPECPKNMLHVLAQLTELKFVGFADSLQTDEPLRLAA